MCDGVNKMYQVEHNFVPITVLHWELGLSNRAHFVQFMIHCISDYGQTVTPSFGDGTLQTLGHILATVLSYCLENVVSIQSQCLAVCL